MPDTLFVPPSASAGARSAAELVAGPLLDSRQRWQHMVHLAADLAFETDEKGRFSFVMPDQVLGWPSSALIGQPSELLLPNATDATTANPFRPGETIRARRIWVKRYDGSLACLSFAAAPLHDAQNNVIGARGLAFDVTEHHAKASRIAASHRRGEVLDYILWCVAQEVMAPRMMDAALSALANALAAEGATVIATRASGGVELLHEIRPRLGHDPGGGGQAGARAWRRTKPDHHN